MGKFPPEPTSESSSHSAHCHCGAVRFSFTLSPPLHEYPANSCNCSICTKNGYLIVYPWLKDFKLESGKDMLKNHMFGLKRTEHQFCSNCGSSCLLHIVEEGAPPIIGVNLRMLTDFDIEKLNLNKMDGKSLWGEYQPANGT